MGAPIFDLIALGIILATAIVGMCRGFFASLLSLLGFVGTFVVAYFFTDNVLGLLDQMCNLTQLLQNFAGSKVGKILAMVIAFLATYLTIRVVVFILHQTVGRLFKVNGVGGMNSVMGGLLGAVKGAVYVVLLLVLLNVASMIPTVKNWTTVAFQDTYVVGQVYDWVGLQLGNYFNPDGETTEVPENT